MAYPQQEVAIQSESKVVKEETFEDDEVPQEDKIDNTEEIADKNGAFDESEGINGSSSDSIDTTAEFLQIFQGKTEFQSWAEFHTLFEQFQKETGSGQ